MRKFIPITLTFAVAIVLSCSSKIKTTSGTTRYKSDSLWVTVTSDNLSENLTGNDEILVMCYLYRDSMTLDELLFGQKLRINAKNLSRKFKLKLHNDIGDRPMLLFLVEQDSETPLRQIDSTLRVSHRNIMTEFKKGNYSGIEKYLGDEDVLGYEMISAMDYNAPNLYHFSGVYKLDRYEYWVKIETARHY